VALNTKNQIIHGMSTKEDDYLKFLFEMSEDFSVIPSFGDLRRIGDRYELLGNPTT
jgi:hypothetical protein